MLHVIIVIYQTIKESIKKMFTLIYNYISKSTLESVFLDLVWVYSTIHTYCMRKIDAFYEDNPECRKIADAILEMLENSYKTMMSVRIEPTILPWGSTIRYYKISIDGGNNYSIREKYTQFEDTSSGELKSWFSSEIENAKDVLSLDNSLQEMLVILKTTEYTKCNVFKNDAIRNPGEKSEDEFTPEPSNAKFLMVEYSHPKMNEAIALNVDKSYFQIGNQILSGAFILRLLEHQVKPFVFDEDYSLTLMDSDINQKTLKSKQYILLEENSYQIV